MSFIGRQCAIARVGSGAGPESFSGMYAKKISVTHGELDVTGGEDDGYRYLLDDPEQTRMDLSLEGVLKDDQVISLIANGTTQGRYIIDFGPLGSLVGDFQIDAMDMPAEHNAATKYALVMKSTGPYEYTPSEIEAMPVMPTATLVRRHMAATLGEPFYSSPIYVSNFSNSGFGPAPVLIFQGWDWTLNVTDAVNGGIVLQKVAGANNYGKANYVRTGGNQYLLMASHDGTVTCFDEEGTQQWQYENLYFREGNYPDGGNPTAVGASTIEDSGKDWPDDAFKRIYGLGENALIDILDGPAGSVVQTHEIADVSSGVITTATPFSPSITTGDYYRIRPRYESDVYFQHVGSINIESGTPFLYQGSFDCTVTKIDMTDGSVQWVYVTGENIEPPPIVHDFGSPWGEYVFASSVDGSIHILDPSDGSLVQKITSPAGAGVGGFDSFLQVSQLSASGPPWVHTGCRDGRIYFIAPWSLYNGSNGDPFVLSARSSQFESLGGHQINASQAVAPNDNGTSDVLFCNDPGFVGRVDKEGNTQWRASEAPALFNSTPVVADVNYDGEDEVVFCDMAGALHIYTLDGVKIGSLYELGGIEGIPIIQDIDNDGAIEVVVPSLDGHVSVWRLSV